MRVVVWLSSLQADCDASIIEYTNKTNIEKHIFEICILHKCAAPNAILAFFATKVFMHLRPRLLPPSPPPPVSFYAFFLPLEVVVWRTFRHLFWLNIFGWHSEHLNRSRSTISCVEVAKIKSNGFCFGYEGMLFAHPATETSPDIVADDNDDDDSA